MRPSIFTNSAAHLGGARFLWRWCAWFWLCCALPSWAGGPPAAPQGPILVLGDSLSAEFGLQKGQGWVALLGQRLAHEHIALSLVNASISGETTAGGRARLQALLKLHHPSVVIIELGGNDALRGLALSATADNLAAMTRAARAAGAKVVITGLELPPNYGPQFTEQFAQIFGKVARQEGAALVPFFLKNVADTPHPLELFQDDGIHPRAQAHPLILDNVWTVLAPLVPKPTP